LTVVNLHLPPSLPVSDRRTICGDVAGILKDAPAGAQLICGDLNEWPRSQGGGWLSKALQPSGVWSGFRSPYPPGDATNHVHSRRGTSARELDWVLIGPNTPCTACHKALLPGLSTHVTLQVDLVIPTARISAADPSGRQFRYRSALPVDLEAAAAIVSLLLYWAAAGKLDPDAAVRLCWDGLRGHIPTSKPRLHVRPQDAAIARAELSAPRPYAGSHP
jgi:hypothetical protein